MAPPRPSRSKRFRKPEQGATLRHRANTPSRLGSRGPLFVGAALIVLALLAACATPALAVETHPFTNTSIGPGGAAAAGEFTDLAAVTVDSSGNLYVLD